MIEPSCNFVVIVLVYRRAQVFALCKPRGRYQARDPVNLSTPAKIR